MATKCDDTWVSCGVWFDESVEGVALALLSDDTCAYVAAVGSA